MTTAPAFSVEEPTAERPLAVVYGEGTSPLDLAPADLERLFRAHGAILLRGFDMTIERYRDLAKRLCSTSVFNESPGRMTLDAATQIQTVNLGTDAFPLHPELSREPWRPDACLFYCLEPDSSGGETTVCDGIAIVENLPSALVEQMRGHSLLYIKPASPAVLRYWLGTEFPGDALLAAPPSTCPYWFRRVGNAIVRGFGRPLLHQPMFDERLAFGNFLLFARDYMRVSNIPCLDDGTPVTSEWLAAVREAARPVTYPVPWQKDDVVILDNSRFMHGRRAISDPGKRRIASYFGYVSFAPPQPGEPQDPVWRREDFRPPAANN